jgi:hypothetical protein
MSLVSKYVKQVKCRDLTFKQIHLHLEALTDSQVAELIVCLLANPDVVTHIHLGINQLTDETGVKLAQHLAASSTIVWLDLAGNQFGETTYLTIAAALRVNSSLQGLCLNNNKTADWTHIDLAFVDALRLNPNRLCRKWQLYTFNCHTSDFIRLKDAAEKSTPPSMLEFLLCVHLDTEKIKTKIH